MNENVEAFLQSWPWAPWPLFGCAITAIVYARGWTILRRRGSPHFRPAQLAAFLGGMAAVLLAIASPLEPYADLLLSVHMAQHLLLMIVAPALIWLGAPQTPLTLGLPTTVVEHGLTPLLTSRWWQTVVRFVTNPLVCWLAPALALWIWHAPRFYELALEAAAWHQMEHICFLLSALLFWWPVVQPYPSRARWPRVMLIPYLFLAAMQSTALCALLTFSDRVIYPHYAAAPRIWGLSALADQELAGAMMWVVGMITLLPPLAIIGYRMLYDATAPRAQLQYAGLPAAVDLLREPDSPSTIDTLRGAATAHRVVKSSPADLVVLNQAETTVGYDLLRTPVLGPLLRSAITRRIAQAALLLMAAAIILDGLFGPQISPLNLAGVLPWIHWRGLVVLALVVAGNLFCLACPFMLPRAIARRVLTPARDWPAWLRSKWLAVALLVAFFWAYEALDLWASPWWTAWIALAYFLVAFAVDAVFRGAAFCKYVCPVGQFQFVQSLVSPWEVRVREAAVCSTCRTHDCLRGGPHGRGCETDLFAPRKIGNLDCTFCLDCVRSCPSGNIGLIATSPLVALTAAEATGRAARMLASADVAALLLLLVFAAFANAAGMVAPVARAQDRITETLHWPLIAVESAYLAGALIVVPAILLAVAGYSSRRLGRESEILPHTIARFARALVPIGAAMWLAHYGFHLATGPLAFAPPAERFLADWGGPSLGGAQIAHCCCAADVSPWLLRAEILSLDFGWLASLYVGYRIAIGRYREVGRAAWSFLPWAALITLLFAIGVWIVLQPMEMRGMMAAGGGG